MNTYKILWIDDDWGGNAIPLEKQLLQEVKDTLVLTNNNISVTAKASIAEGVVDFFFSKSFNYDLIIVDLRFIADDKTFDIIIENAQRKFLPIIIFSNNLSDYDLSSYTVTSNTFIVDIIEKINKENLIERVLSLSKSKALNIVHISDFHFDSMLKGNAAREQKIRFEKMIDTLEAESRIRPFDLIFFTGDFAAKSPRNDFENCFLIIQELVNKTVGDFSRLCIIPGNHDIEWDDFEKSVISTTPGKAYYEFIKKIYMGSRNEEVLKNLIGWNHKMNQFDDHFEPDYFCWHKNFENLKVEILGLNSATIKAELKGLGQVSEGTMSFIENEWGKPNGTSLRIALVHHNILPPFSMNTLEESSNIRNSGQLIELLAKNNCNLLFSGHCHDSYLYNFSYSVLTHNGFSGFRNLTYVSTGTSGGYAPNYDRARSFNIIHLGPQEAGERSIILTPYLYDSRLQEWAQVTELNTTLKVQNQELFKNR